MSTDIDLNRSGEDWADLLAALQEERAGTLGIMSSLAAIQAADLE